MEKFTKGPWHVVHNGCYFEVVVPWEDGGGEVNQYCPSICAVFETGNDGLVGRHNVDLIGQAPLMYAALKELCDSCMGECGDCKVSGILKAARGES